ncbi:MAG: hypothetical protein ACYCX3_05060 [Thermoleophilia bacterium]
MTSSDRERDLELLRRFEPQLRLNRGELFQPMDVDPYLAETDLVLHRRGERPTVLQARPGVTQESLAANDREPHAGTVHLRLVARPLKALQLVQFHSRSELREFTKGITRHARVGLTARLLDVAFRISLVARGRVPGGTAAAAALAYKTMRESAPDPVYYGRVVRTRSYTVLQYWMFYAYNDYRSHYHGANDHEGDWEAVSVFLDEGAPGDPAPAWVGYANHDAGGADLRRRWDDPELQRVGEHPVVFAGAGSHAAYFSPGEYVIRIEMPLLARLSATIGAIRSVWRTALRQGGGSPGGSSGQLDIAFVDYARGDGLKIGPGGDQPWDLRLLDDQPALVHYRGLWGRFADDPIQGEDAPAGPRFNRDGSVRVAWYDPVGWVDLTATPPPSRALPTTEAELARLQEEGEALAPRIAEAETEATRLGTRVDGLRETSATSRHLRECEERLTVARERVRKLREESSEVELLSRGLELRLRRLKRADHGDARAHLRRPAVPQAPSQLRMHRIAETWSAISAGLLLLVMGVVVILYHAALLPFLLLFGAFLFVESLFHRRVAALVHGIVVTLTLATLAILIYEFWWQIGVALALALGAVITWANLRELTRS